MGLFCSFYYKNLPNNLWFYLANKSLLINKLLAIRLKRDYLITCYSPNDLGKIPAKIFF